MTEKSSEISKLRIRVGGFEIEAEGSNLNVSEFMERIAQMRQTLGPVPDATIPAVRDRETAPFVAPTTLGMVSTNTIASRINAGTGSDLVMAAMAHLTLVQGKDTASRREILDEMKAAKTFYKETFSGNLSSYLDSLAKAKRLNLVSKETYALPNAERQNFERIMAEAN
jgi:hypothetical protein